MMYAVSLATDNTEDYVIVTNIRPGLAKQLAKLAGVAAKYNARAITVPADVSVYGPLSEMDLEVAGVQITRKFFEDGVVYFLEDPSESWSPAGLQLEGLIVDSDGDACPVASFHDDTLLQGRLISLEAIQEVCAGRRPEPWVYNFDDEPTGLQGWWMTGPRRPPGPGEHYLHGCASCTNGAVYECEHEDHGEEQIMVKVNE